MVLGLDSQKIIKHQALCVLPVVLHLNHHLLITLVNILLRPLAEVQLPRRCRSLRRKTAKIPLKLMMWSFSSPLPLLSGHPHLRSPESGLFDLNTTSQNLKRPRAPLNSFLHERIFPTCHLNLRLHRAHLASALPKPMVQIAAR